MFRSARIKLTGWYLLIIMLISMVFSVVIYIMITNELERGFRRAEMRFRAERLEPPLSRGLENIGPQLIEDLEAAKHRVALNLLVVNGIILVFSASAGYFLAGRTLKPIQEMVDEQNRFVTDSSHELRTPITALKTSIEVGLRDRKLDLKQAKELLESNLEEVNDLQTLSDNLLILAKSQAAQTSLNLQTLSLKDVVNEAIGKVKAMAMEKGIKIDQSIEQVELEGDKDELIRLLVIFLDNAIKFSHRNTSLSLKGERIDKKVKIIISDQGIGIEEKEIPHIFDRFYRTDKSRSKANIPGYGLGLSIAQKIVQLHKGAIAVKSTVGKGATFIVYLPVKQSAKPSNFLS